MLVEFRFSNYKSFRDEQSLSMVASSSKELPNNLIETRALGKGKKLLNAAIVYGANASGKSNLVHAIEFARDLVVRSPERDPGSPIPVQPFILDAESIEAPSTFEFTFVHEGVRYQYGFVVDRKRVHEEWLIAYPRKLPQTWYEREVQPDTDEQHWYWGPNLRGDKSSLSDRTRPDVLFLSVAALFNHEQLSRVYHWFRRGVTVIPVMADWHDLESNMMRRMHRDAEFRENAVNLIRMADFGIDGLIIEESPWEDSKLEEDEDLPEEIRELAKAVSALRRAFGRQETKRLNMSFRHSAGINRGSSVDFPLEYESLGTRRMLALADPLLSALRNGSTLVVDEIDTSLHPLLVQELIKMFSDDELNRMGAQLIFNTHDVTLLDNSLFRRDQIWFTEKKADGATVLYSLLDFQPRKSEALGKNYLQGRYGAIPIIHSLAMDLSTDG